MEGARRRKLDDLDSNNSIDLKEDALKMRKCHADNPVHFPKVSLFTTVSGYTNYSGLKNLCIILLVVSNIRAALENMIKYGILIDPKGWLLFFSNEPNYLPPICVLFSSNFFILSSLGLEYFLLTPKVVSNFTGSIIAVHIVVGLLSLPPIAFNLYQCNPVFASICCVFYSLISLKLTSYHMVNYWCRTNYSRAPNAASNNNSSSPPTNGSAGLICLGQAEDLHPGHVVYPKNLTICDIYYFMFAPTLCYELNFPRNDKIRSRFLIKRIIEMIILIKLDLMLMQQWMVPTIRNSVEPFKEMSYFEMLERLLKLVVPNHLVWIVFFYWYFHSFLNILAEITRFSDREFYRDWWNSKSVSYFWQNWNIPVHRWCLRHVYIPLLSQQKVPLNRFGASTIVFLLSAFFHEYMVSVPLNMYRMWAFIGMLSQLPFSIVVSKYFKDEYANGAVWISLIIGQPLCILMYYHDYYVINVAANN